MIAPVMSLAQLRAKATKDQQYQTLAILTAKKLGYDPDESFCEAMADLHDAAGETSEDEVIEELNFLRGEF